MSNEFYKRFRPKKLDQVVGNTATVKTLTNMLKQKTLPHTLLIHGPSGCGKTTLGRILRRELGCGNSDYRELNCSDFRGIDTVREISRSMTLAPIGGVCRVFLLDEVHQLSKDGQNAALKILEDTPSHVYFILCTTDPGKLLKTIRTRCCELPVTLLEDEELSTLVKTTCQLAGVKLSRSSRDELVEAAGGSARTALVLLDKIANLEDGERSEALKKKVEEENEAIDLCRALLKKEDWNKVIKILKGLQAGDEERIRHAVLGYARNCLLSGNKGIWHQSYNIIMSFEKPFYDTKHTGLAKAAFESIFGGG